MKIDGTRPIAPAQRRDRAKSSDQGGFEPSGESAKARGGAPLGGPASVASVDALLALQGGWDERDPREQAAGRAFDLLDILDDIKIGLLGGGIPRAKLDQLVRALGETRESTGDERLESLLDEVETRARVELAKREASLV